MRKDRQKGLRIKRGIGVAILVTLSFGMYYMATQLQELGVGLGVRFAVYFGGLLLGIVAPWMHYYPNKTRRIGDNSHFYMQGLAKKLGFLPKITESTVFLLSLIWILLLGLTPLRGEVLSLILEIWNDGGLFNLLPPFVFFGLACGLFFAFTSKKPTPFQFSAIKMFVYLSLVASAIGTGVIAYETREGAYIVPVVISSLQILALAFLHTENRGRKGIEYVREDAKTIHLLLALLVGVGVFAVETYILQAHWIIVISSSLYLWSVLESLFFGDQGDSIQETELVRMRNKEI